MNVKRQNLFNICGIISLTSAPPQQNCSFVLRTVYFPNKANQTEKVFDPEKWASSGNGDKWICWSDVRPVMRYGGPAAFRVIKENATFIWKSPYTVYFKLDTAVWMERMSNPEGFVVKILMGRSWTTWLFIPDGELVGFWYGIMTPPQEIITSFYLALAKSVQDVFPITFRANEGLATGITTGLIPGFCSRGTSDEVNIVK